MGRFLEQGNLAGCEQYIHGLHIGVSAPVLFQRIGLFIAHDHDVVLTVNPHTMLQLHHFGNMLQKRIGEVFLITGHKIGAVVFQVCRDAIRIFLSIRSNAGNNCFNTRICDFRTNTIFIVGT